ncbi:hypothetical protein FDA33_17465 [Clostridium botulinum]|uniref:Uncharacterized protein n=1 Tax=Clostridium botulinum TaxID=1491 RepID=A0A6B4S2I7_CLOBO|nr:hypothetical protein [Clostridium botulinum]EES51041.1 hypothetical protein CLO_1552 [Clostridium botulinum E1 str. 'BoNT E Beluga']MBY6762855.1 hypothetical protein [Clostridium botulinum]MBY6915391.1 hypothetical protein [Clostridium botulinum]MBY6921639.1 hypothetical protein [Clostridium botulinum]MCR1132841.1 hypothetical protein [Clostridium botulinum]
MEKQLTLLKKKYNYNLNRNKNAEEHLKTHDPEECITKKFKGKTALDGFNEIAVELSKLRIEIEQRIYRDMTAEEILNGFNL